MVKKGIVFDIQRYAIHDGPGIRTLVFLKGCPLRCLWCENPESQAIRPELLFYPDRCISCGACVEACLHAALRLSGESLHYDRERCRHCLACTRVCPSRALERCGEPMSVEEVLAVVMRDKPFYAQSGGGVTLSGGEPLVQAEFVTALLEACKSEGIHTAIETSGHWKWAAFEPAVPFVDLVLFDIKHLDGVQHDRGTSVGNDLILDNLDLLDRRSIPVIVRLPVIPGYNDGDDVVSRTAHRLARMKSLKAVHLLPYHALGVHKYRLLGKEYRLDGIRPPAAGRMLAIKAILEAAGLHAVIEG
jgi:pyruvate formate lyase activating enzyme